MRTLRNIWTISRLICCERWLATLIATTIVFVVAMIITSLLPSISEGDRVRLFRSVILEGAAFLAVITGLLTAATTLPRDHEAGLAGTLLATPLRRETYLLGVVGGSMALTLMVLGALTVAGGFTLRFVGESGAQTNGTVPPIVRTIEDLDESDKPKVLAADTFNVTIKSGQAMSWKFPSHSGSSATIRVKPRTVIVEGFPRVTQQVECSLQPTDESLSGPFPTVIRSLQTGEVLEIPFKNPPPGPEWEFWIRPLEEDVVLRFDLSPDPFGRERRGVLLLTPPMPVEFSLFGAMCSVAMEALYLILLAAAVSSFASSWIATCSALVAWLAGKLVPVITLFSAGPIRSTGSTPGHTHDQGPAFMDQLAWFGAKINTMLFPDLTALDPANAFVDGLIIPGHFVGASLFLVLPYLVGFGVIGCLVARRKEAR